MDELALVQAALDGELDAFNRLVLAYQDLAYNVAFRMMGDEDEASDATQTAFISAYKNLRSFRGGSFKAWVLRMVTNSCYDELRRKHRHPTTPLEPVNEEDGEQMDTPSWIASNEPQPEDSLAVKELEHAIQHCLDKLTPDFRSVVVLVDLQVWITKKSPSPPACPLVPSRAGLPAPASSCVTACAVSGTSPR